MDKRQSILLQEGVHTGYMKFRKQNANRLGWRKCLI